MISKTLKPKKKKILSILTNTLDHHASHHSLHPFCLGLSIIKTTVSQPGSGDGSPGSDSDATFCLFNAIDIVPYLPSGATLTTSCCQLASGIGTNLLAVSIYERNPANYFPPTHLSKLCNTCDEASKGGGVAKRFWIGVCCSQDSR